MIRETRGSADAKRSIEHIDSKKLAFALKRVRFDAGMTQDEVAKKMGYGYGGMTKKKSGMMGGGMAKKRMGYKDGGLACGASNPPERPMKKSS